MKAAPPAGLADPAAELEALIREARRRQHRRWLVAGVAATAALASGAGIIAGSRTGTPRPPRRHATATPPAHAIRPSAAPLLGPSLPGAATTVVMWPVGYPVFGPDSGPAAYVDNLSTGQISRRQVPGIIGCDCQPYLIDVGRRLVYVGSGGITAVSPDLKGKPRLLGATEFFAPLPIPATYGWCASAAAIWARGRSGPGPCRSTAVRQAGRSPCLREQTCSSAAPPPGSSCRADAASSTAWRYGDLAARQRTCRIRLPTGSPTASTPARGWSPTAVGARSARQHRRPGSMATTCARCCASWT